MKFDNQAASFLGHRVPASRSKTTGKKFVKKGAKVALVAFVASHVQLVSGHRVVEVDKLKEDINTVSKDKGGAYLRTKEDTNAVFKDKGVAYLRTDETNVWSCDMCFDEDVGNEDRCTQYKVGGLDWDWRADCKEEGYENVLRERNATHPRYFDYSSFQACRTALYYFYKYQRVMKMDLDFFNEETFYSEQAYSNTKPPGCYVECINGIPHGRFNKNAWNHISNPGNNDTQPVCVGG